jgi:hypothetical protein
VKKTKPRFIKASGAPFSDEDIQLIGAELLKIAEANRIRDVRLLDKKIVFAAIEVDPNHPLRRFYDWDIKKAARKHWVEWTHKLIMSVRIEWAIGKFTRPLPITLSADVPRLQYGATRKRVLTQDALLSNPIFASAVGIRLRSLDQQLAQLEALVAEYKGARLGVEPLLKGLRDQFEAHYSTLKAAE